MVIFIILLAVIVGYRASIRLSAHYLSVEDTTPQLLRWGQLGCFFFSIILITVAMKMNWAIYYEGFCMCVFLGSGWMAGVRERLGLFFSWRATLAKVYSWLTLLLFPLLLLWLMLISPASGFSGYVGPSMRVEIAQHFSLLRDDQDYLEVLLIQRQGILWEKQVGKVGIQVARGIETPQWWTQVHFVQLHPDRHVFSVFKYGQKEPIELSYNVPYGTE